jgi:hypothetical protein
VEWDRDALAALAAGRDDVGAVWRLAGELDWDEVDALRVISGRLADSRTLAIAAIRPARAAGHGEEAIAGAIAGPDGLEALDEVLLSTEVADDGALRRIGLELYRDGDDLPLRLAGDAAENSATREGELMRRRAVCDLRAGDSRGGVALVEVLSRS